jgi:hypothetical protein
LVLGSQQVSDVNSHNHHVLKLVLGGLGLAASVFVLYNTLPDLVRYIRIRRM